MDDGVRKSRLFPPVFEGLRSVTPPSARMSLKLWLIHAEGPVTSLFLFNRLRFLPYFGFWRPSARGNERLYLL